MMAKDQQMGTREPTRMWAYRIAFGCLTVAGLLALAGAGDSRWAIPGLSPDQRDYFVGFGVGLLIAGAIVAFLKGRMARSLNENGTVDAVQRLQRRMLLSISALIVAFGGLAIRAPLRHPGSDQYDFAIEFAMIAIAAAAAVTFGVGFVHRRYRLASSDEFTKALRLRSVQLGYMLAVAGTAVVYIVNIFRPDVTNFALPAALLVAVFGPCLYFLIGERLANA